MQSALPRALRAVVLIGHGGLDRLSVRDDWPVPSPGPHQALVAPGACGLNNTDVNTRTAWYSAGVSVAPRAALLFTLAALVAAGAAAGEASLRERLAAASPERGQEVFRACSACHSVDKGAAHTIGPNLWGVVDRAVATAEGYDRYTPAMTSFGGAWSAERLDRYLRQPMTVIEGTAMIFPGITSDVDRADLIAWLGLKSPDPTDFASRLTIPEGAAGTGNSRDTRPTAPQSSRSPDLGVLVAGDGAEETHAYCTACHSERIVAQQGLTRADWEELLEQMVEENEMNPIEEPDLGRVLAYLAAHYGPDRPNFPNR